MQKNDKQNKEIEVRFLNIDKDALLKKLSELGARDFGEVMLEETIVYDRDLKWKVDYKFIRIRKAGDKISMSYKENFASTLDTFEIEFEVSDYKKAEQFLEKAGLMPYRHQQKKRHTLELDGITFDIDTWPNVPPYVELEGESAEVLRAMAEKIGYDWKDVVLKDAAFVLENMYNIPVRKLRWFMFDRVE